MSPTTWNALTQSKLVSGISESSHTSSELRPTHVAFGTKVAIPDHILTSRQVLPPSPF